MQQMLLVNYDNDYYHGRMTLPMGQTDGQLSPSVSQSQSQQSVSKAYNQSFDYVYLFSFTFAQLNSYLNVQLISPPLTFPFHYNSKE